MSDELAPNREADDAEPRKSHYGDGVQPWDIIVASGWGPAFAAANVVKYLRRSKNPAHSLESALWYYERLYVGAADERTLSLDGGGFTVGESAPWTYAVLKLELLLTKEELQRLRAK